MLAGAVQGFLLAGVLAAHRGNRTANRLLAILVATFTVYLLQTVYYSAGLIRAYPHFFGISYPLPWVFGPLVYLYARAASNSTWRFHARHALHFAPVAIVVLIALPNYLLSGPAKVALYERLQSGDAPALIRVLEPFKYVSGFAYSMATVAYLNRHRRAIKDSYSNTDRVNLLWLLWLSGAAAAIWVLAVTIDLADVVPLGIQRQSDDLVAVAIALMVYAIGYMGLRQPEIFRYESAPPPAPPEIHPAAGATTESLARTPAVVESPDVREPAGQGEVEDGRSSRNEQYERYERSGLNAAEAGVLKLALLSLMTRERPYRDPDLTLPNLAERLNTTPHKLSEVLNAEIGQTFYDFVNSYRVDDVRRRLAKAESKQVNVLTLAMDAGFASKSTFNQVFKKQTGQTPTAYRQAVAG